MERKDEYIPHMGEIHLSTTQRRSRALVGIM